ncbi:MAG: DUF393 domain-containing protein [Pseudomonadota bacterium]
MTMPRPDTLQRDDAHSCSASGPTVYFDGSCPLCTVEIKHYASRENGESLDFVDVSAGTRALGPGLDADAAMRRFHVRLPDGSLLSGARAFIAIWETLPGWRWLATVAQVPGVPTLLEGAYRVFLPIRPILSRIAQLLGAQAANPKGDTR